jgi:hypothetical protein
MPKLCAVTAVILSTCSRPTGGDVLTKGQVVELSGEDLAKLKRSGHARIATPAEIPQRPAKADKPKPAAPDAAS